MKKWLQLRAVGELVAAAKVGGQRQLQNCKTPLGLACPDGKSKLQNTPVTRLVTYSKDQAPIKRL